MSNEAEPAMSWGVNQTSFLYELRGEPVAVITLDQRMYRGKLVGYDVYTLFVQIEDRVTMIPKHAVKLMHEDRSGESDG